MQQIRDRVKSSSASSSSSTAAACVSPRRAVLLGAAVSALALSSPLGLPAAQAVTFAPPGFRTQDDKLDGYTFFYPEGWLPVSSSGNDCFLRNPRNIEENCFVDITSPSSSTFNSVTELGTPQETANRLLDQYLNKEFMSTRLGIRREGQVLFADSREGKDGRTYYDIGIRMSSFASSNPYVATQGEVMQEYGMEWDRVLLTTLGVANKRIYELRLQTAQNTYESSKPKLDQMRTSFALRDVDTAGS